LPSCDSSSDSFAFTNDLHGTWPRRPGLLEDGKSTIDVAEEAATIGEKDVQQRNERPVPALSSYLKTIQRNAFSFSIVSKGLQ
jgi:hypothetical protein